LLDKGEMELLFNKSHFTSKQFQALIMGREDQSRRGTSETPEDSQSRQNIQLPSFIMLLSKVLSYEHLFELVRQSTIKFFDANNWSIHYIFECLCDDSLDLNNENLILTPIDFKSVVDLADLKLQLINSTEEGINSLELQMFFDWYDETGDGTVTFEEFWDKMAPRAVETISE